MQSLDEWGTFCLNRCFSLPHGFVLLPIKAEIFSLFLVLLPLRPLQNGVVYISTPRLEVALNLELPFSILERPPLCIGAWLEKHGNCAGVGRALNF